jgi:hypothetical protein
MIDTSPSRSDAPHIAHDILDPTSDVPEALVEQGKHESTVRPLFVMMGQKDISSAPKIKMNRKTTIAARKSVTR